MRKCLIFGGVALAVLALVAWFEPTRVIMGTLRCESFSAGRPTSFWKLALVSDDPATKENAYKTLKDGAADSVGVLVALLGEPDGSPAAAELRWTAAEILGKIGPPAKVAAQPMLAALDDRDLHVRSVAAAALPEIDTPAETAVPALQKLLPTATGRTAARALSKYRAAASPAIPLLVEMLNDKSLDSETRWNAARTLGKIGPAAKEAIPALVANLKDDVETVREHAAEALGDIGPVAKETVPALVDVLSDPAVKVRRDAVRSLGQIGPAAKEAVPAIQKLLADPEKIVQDAAQKALQLIAPEEAAASETKPDAQTPPAKSP